MLVNRSKAFRSNAASFAMTSVACFAFSLIALLLMHVLRPDYSPTSHMISEYAVGRYGWIMTTSFLALGCGCLTLLLALSGSEPGSVAAWIGILLMGIPSIGLVVSAFFPMDAPESPPTRTGDVHNISFLANVVSIVLATSLLSVGFWIDPRWRSFRRLAVALTSLIVIGVIVQFLTLQRGAPFGLANRCFAATL